MEAIASRLEAIAVRFEAIASRLWLEAIALRLGAIIAQLGVTSRLEAIASRSTLAARCCLPLGNHTCFDANHTVWHSSDLFCGVRCGIFPGIWLGCTHPRKVQKHYKRLTSTR